MRRRPVQSARSLDRILGYADGKNAKELIVIRLTVALLIGLALQGCATAPPETFATPPSPTRPAAATDYGVDIPTVDELPPAEATPPTP